MVGIDHDLVLALGRAETGEFSGVVDDVTDPAPGLLDHASREIAQRRSITFVINSRVRLAVATGRTAPIMNGPESLTTSHML